MLILKMETNPMERVHRQEPAWNIFVQQSFDLCLLFHSIRFQNLYPRGKSSVQIELRIIPQHLLPESIFFFFVVFFKVKRAKSLVGKRFYFRSLHALSFASGSMARGRERRPDKEFGKVKSLIEKAA